MRCTTPGASIRVSRSRSRRRGPAGRPARSALRILLALSLLAGSAARAHIEVGERSLVAQVAGAALVVHAEIETAGERYEATEGGLARPIVRARVIETLKGSASWETVVFAQHGHGVADYAVGDRALLFLDPVTAHRELGALASLPGAPRFVSRQEHDEAYRVDGAIGETLLAAVRDLVRAQAPPTGDAAPSRDERRALIRRATLALLTSGDARLGSSVLATLGAESGARLIEAEDLPRLLAVTRDPRASVGFRAALLSQLEALGLLPLQVASEWHRLVASVPRAERGRVLRAAGASTHPEVADLLIGYVGGEDPGLASEAAIALARPDRARAVPALARALSSADARLRGAAIRALTAIASPDARAALGRAASAHPDPSTRRRAAAATKRLGTDLPRP